MTVRGVMGYFHTKAEVTGAEPAKIRRGGYICVSFRDFVTLCRYVMYWGPWGENTIGLVKILQRAVVALVCGVWSPAMSFGAAVPAGVFGQEESTVTIRIEGRRFVPHVMNLRVGQQVHLVPEERRR